MFATYRFLVLAICLAVCYSNPLLRNEDLEDDNQINNTGRDVPTNIIGGKHTKIVKHPYQVAIIIDGLLAGSGIIIDRTHIVTTASLVNHEHKDNIIVVVGNSNFHRGAKHAVKKVTHHKKFNAFTLDHDVAILQLENRVRYSKTVKKINIAKKSLSVGSVVTMSGWGDTSDNPEILAHPYKQANVNLISKKRCQKALHGYPITGTMICALKEKVRPCHSDFGNVIVSKGKAYGLFSWAKSCSSKLPSVFTNLVLLRSWVEYTVNSNYKADNKMEHVIAKRSPISFLDDNIVTSNNDVSSMVEIAITREKLEEEEKEDENQRSVDVRDPELQNAIQKEEDEEAVAEEEEKEQEEDEDKQENEAIDIANQGLKTDQPNDLDSNEYEINHEIKYHPLRKREINNKIYKDDLTESDPEDQENDDDEDLKVGKDSEEEKEAEELEHEGEDSDANTIEEKHELIDTDDDGEEVVDFYVEEANDDSEKDDEDSF